MIKAQSLLLYQLGVFISMAFDESILYHLARDFGLADLEAAARQAGVMSVLQVSAYYAERRIRHSVARVVEFQLGDVRLEVVYEGFNQHKPLRHSVKRDQLEKLVDAMRQARFDRLSDQNGLSFTDRSLWLIQRAAGAYSHGIVVAPDKPQLPWSSIVNAIDQYLPQAIREVPLRY